MHEVSCRNENELLVGEILQLASAKADLCTRKPAKATTAR